jgi:hypothetical protein
MFQRTAETIKNIFNVKKILGNIFGKKNKNRNDKNEANGDKYQKQNEQKDIENKKPGKERKPMHEKRIESLANAVIGAINAGSLSISAMGRGLSCFNSLCPKHATKQIDRLLSNENLKVWEIFPDLVKAVVGEGEKTILVAMDWTDFDKDDQATLSLNVVMNNGRSIPVVWLTMWKEEIKDNRNDIEDTCLNRLKECLPEKVKVTVLADRGFGDHKLFRYLKELGFGYVIRFRDNIHITSEDGETRLASEWLGPNGEARKLPNAKITRQKQPAGTVVCVHDEKMKDMWCLATSEEENSAQEIIDKYAFRWTAETTFRDTKDPHFGLGMEDTRISEPERRDKLLLVNSLAILVLTTLGTAGEETKLDKKIKPTTAKRRTHSVFQQGRILLKMILTMRDAWFTPLISRFEELINQNGVAFLYVVPS